MTASEIQLGLMSWIHSTPSDIIVPNYYVGRWEMDVCKVTKAGQMTEYEIKTSKADFKKDWEKSYTPYSLEADSPRPPVSKHSEIQAGRRCNKFYFVCPKDLIRPEQVPAGYGLIYVEFLTEHPQGHKIFRFHVAKRARQWTTRAQPFEMFRDLAINIGCKYVAARSKASRIQWQYEKLKKEQKNQLA